MKFSMGSKTAIPDTDLTHQRPAHQTLGPTNLKLPIISTVSQCNVDKEQAKQVAGFKNEAIRVGNWGIKKSLLLFSLQAGRFIQSVFKYV